MCRFLLLSLYLLLLYLFPPSFKIISCQKKKNYYIYLFTTTYFLSPLLFAEFPFFSSSLLMFALWYALVRYYSATTPRRLRVSFILLCTTLQMTDAGIYLSQEGHQSSKDNDKRRRKTRLKYSKRKVQIETRYHSNCSYFCNYEQCSSSLVQL